MSIEQSTEMVDQTVVQPGASDKATAIASLVQALEAFANVTPVTEFPDHLAEKVKSARSAAAELKDDLQMIQQQLEEAKDDLSKLSPDRFASFSNRLDVVASSLQAAGLLGLATGLDAVSNTLDRSGS